MIINGCNFRITDNGIINGLHFLNGLWKDNERYKTKETGLQYLSALALFSRIIADSWDATVERDHNGRHIIEL